MDFKELGFLITFKDFNTLEELNEWISLNINNENIVILETFNRFDYLCFRLWYIQ